MNPQAPMKTAILTNDAPKPRPGISQAIVAGGFVFCSGAVPMDAETMKIIPGDIQTHTVGHLVIYANESLHLLAPVHQEPYGCA
jgi:hypothetical protein